VGRAPLSPLERRGRWIALAVLAVMLALQAAERLPLQTRLRAFLFDTYQDLAPRERVSAPAIIIDIDEASLQRFGQWPWPRSLLAQLVARIAALGPAAIGLDLLMPEPDGASPCAAARYIPGVAPDLERRLCALPSNDALLARALAEARAVLSVAGVDRATDARLLAPPLLAIGDDPKPLLRRFEGALTSVAVLHEAAAGHALVSADTERGILRWVPLAARVGETVMPALSVEMLRLAAKQSAIAVRASAGRVVAIGVGDLQVPTQSDGRLRVHYGHMQADRYVSAAAVLSDAVSPELIRDRLVLVGVSGLGLVDFPMTALGERVPGVEVHAQVLESIFDGTTLLRPHWSAWAEGAALAVLGLATILGIGRMNSMAAVLAILVVSAALLVAGFLLFARGRMLLDAATPALLFVLLFGGLLTYELMREQVERRDLEASLRLQREAAARTAGEVAAARRIQLGMVPDPHATFAHEPRIDIAARMEPARDVGGDLYDCFMLDADRVFFLVGDVCGKGIPASLFMATSKTLCKSVALRGGADLGALMRQANREIARDNSEMLFVTVFAGVLDLRSGELAYANAGHERPFVAAPGRAPASLDQEGGPPLGIVDSADYPIARYRLASDEYLCIVTDGVAEATDANGDFFGRERLRDALGAVTAADTAAAVLDALVARVDAFGAGAERADDVTALVLRWRGPARA
jgi:adenylate cyclase